MIGSPHLSLGHVPLYMLAPPFPKTKAKTNKLMRYRVHPFETLQEFELKKKRRTRKEKKTERGERKEFGMTSTPLRHALLGAIL